jgi:hypothetical protein
LKLKKLNMRVSAAITNVNTQKSLHLLILGRGLPTIHSFPLGALPTLGTKGMFFCDFLHLYIPSGPSAPSGLFIHPISPVSPVPPVGGGN